jgi:hypothetical protein
MAVAEINWSRELSTDDNPVIVTNNGQSRSHLEIPKQNEREL